jgi:hypothetical protein
MEVYYENRTEQINTTCGQNAEIFVLSQAIHIVTISFSRVSAIARRNLDAIITANDIWEGHAVKQN